MRLRVSFQNVPNPTPNYKLIVKATLIRYIGPALLSAFIAAGHPARGDDTGPLHLTDQLKSDLSALSPLVAKSLDPNSLNGKPVVVTFFASWCPPCREEFKQLNEFVRTMTAGRVTVLAVNLYEDWFGVDEERMQLFLEKYSPRFYVVEGNESIKHAFNDVDRIPTLYIFDSNGIPVDIFTNERGAAGRLITAPELEEIIERL